MRHFTMLWLIVLFQPNALFAQEVPIQLFEGPIKSFIILPMEL